jgi:hypothetical protein
MSMSLPRAFEFELVTDDYVHVKVDAHVFIYRIASDRLSLALSRVKHGGRRAHRSSDHYERSSFKFAMREAAARGVIAGRSEPARVRAAAHENPSSGYGSGGLAR